MKLFSFWLGSNEMSEARRSALASMRNSGLDVEFLRHDDLGKYITESDLHPAFSYLSDNHKSDYLRCLFMHRFGGGYADIKWIEDSWLPEARRLEQSSDLLGSGYRERRPSSVANNFLCAQLLEQPRWQQAIAYARYQCLQRRYETLIATNAFIFKPNTEFTEVWWQKVNRRLNCFLESLKERPARHPREGAKLVIDGRVSDYPIPWVYLAGSIIHPLAYQYRRRLSRALPPLKFKQPGFDSYL